MNQQDQKYCLDANVLINAWNQYYSKTISSGYWEILSRLGHGGRIFLPEHVKEEIVRTDDTLADWLLGSSLPVYPVDSRATEIVGTIFTADPRHALLVDNTKGRSLADPWVIAHAIAENACVVTKENKVTSSDKRVKIPNVCEKMGVRCINDFDMIRELGIRFSCAMD
jgi:predicted nucleic acid-binding protein